MLPEDYQAWSRDDKVAHWAGVLYREMRWAGESNVEEIGILDRPLLAKLHDSDPQIEELMPSVLTYLARMWLEKPAGFLERVNAQMGTRFAVDEKLAAASFRLGRSGGPPKGERSKQAIAG